jgi:hypothetical protein
MLNHFLDAVIGIQLEEEHKVDIVSPGAVENRNILHTNDGGHSLVSADTQHTENLFTKLDPGHNIVEDGKEVVFILCMLVDILHVFENLGEILGRLNEILHRLVDLGLWRVRHEYTDVLLEVVLHDVG